METNNKPVLEEGIISSRDLAEWFGISFSTMKNGRRRKLEELKLFAEFEDLGRKGILIKRVILPIYEKRGSENKKYMSDHFNEELAEEGGKATMSYLGHKLKEKGKLPIARSTSEKMAREVRNEILGKPDDPNSLCHMELGKIDRVADGKAYFLTEEDKALIVKLIEKYYKTIPEKVAEIHMELGAGEITEKEARIRMDKLYNYGSWLRVCADFEAETGYWPQKITVDDRGKKPEEIKQ